MQFSLTFCMEFDLFLWHLPFLSFHTDHHMQAGIILHHFFLVLLPPLLIQQLNRFAVCSGIVQLLSVSLKNRDHSWPVTLQCRKRWLLVSFVSLHRKHLGTSCTPFLCSILCQTSPLSYQPYKAFDLGWCLACPYIFPSSLGVVEFPFPSYRAC